MHTHKHRQTYKPANIYMHRETKTKIYAAHTREHRNRTHNTEYTEQTENKHTSTHLYAQLFTYIVLILLYRVHIKKLYNTDIYEIYIFCSPYWWGEQITIYILKSILYCSTHIKNSYNRGSKM